MNKKMPAGRKPRVMFVTTEETKEALEAWASDTEMSVSSLLDEVVRQLLVREGYLKAPKKLLNWSDRKT